VMLTSAADTYQSGTIGVVLTGANEDGASGLAHVVKRGGRALVQDPKTAEIPIMPEAAIRTVPTAQVLPLDDLAPRLIEMSREEMTTGRGMTV
jgi:two-component system, chemotaxis family, protein-glutamate methylesterase/glutaminase